MGWGALLWLGEWWAVNGATVLRWARLVGVAVLGGVVLFLAAVWWWRRRSARGCSEAGGEGWALGDRDVFAVVPAVGGGRRKPPGMGQRRGKAVPALELWPAVLRQSFGLGSSRGVARVMWARDGGKLMWGVSVDRQIGASVRRSVGSVWSDTRIERGPKAWRFLTVCP